MHDFPGSPGVKNLPASAEDTGSDLVREDSTHQGATKPKHLNNWAHVCPTAHDPQREKPPQWEAHTPQLEKPLCAATKTQHGPK